YDDKPVPRLLLLSHAIEEQDLLAAALSEKAGRKVDVRTPERGEKKALVDHAMTNAREALGRRLAESSSQARLLHGLAEVFGLDEAPRRVEVYDNSHVSGTNAVGAMIVAGPEGFAKKEYRKFNIKSAELAPGDDYAMMREVLTRRFSRLVREAVSRNGDDEATPNPEMPPWPDLVLIDGGRGQLGIARQVMAELGIDDVALVGIAKGTDRDAGREQFFLGDRSPFRLPPRDPVLYFVQRLRDEAHRFAIGTHRARRSKEIVKNPLDEIGGIGPGRKRALLEHFGTAKAVSRAGLADLESVPGISGHMARAIYDFFHEGGE
ncbi:MAG: excinuclease ABC subunit UvrC, partial [Hyphomicrobiales bacterium]|nr:excinuclease ABC subunit UvrC [Hyphomicrobiales bacterium]